RVIGIEYRVDSRLELRALPALVAASEMLELPWPALEAMVHEALDHNPALIRLDAAECPVCQDRWAARCPACAPPRTGDPGHDRGRAEAAVMAGPDYPAPQSDADALLTLVRMEVRPSDAPIAEYIVASLDHHGRLDSGPGEIAAALGTGESAVLRV